MGATKSILCLLLLLWATVAQTEVFEVTGFGIASKMQAGLNAELRQHAIESAEYEAIRRAGVDVSHKHVIRDRESVHNGKARYAHQNKHEIRATEDYKIRLLEILEEGKRGDDYYVRVRIEVVHPEETEMELGFIWKAAGKPAVVLELSETRNGRVSKTSSNRMHDFLLSNLSKHGVLTQKSGGIIHLSVSQQVDVHLQQNVEGVHVYPAHCHLSFRIHRPPVTAPVAEYIAHAGPVAGFSKNGAAESCYEKIALQVGRRLLRELEAQLRDIWQNGSFYQVVVKISDENRAVEVMNVLSQGAHDFSAQLINLHDRRMRWHVVFDGAVDNLVEELVQSLSYSDIPVVIAGISGNSIFLEEKEE